VPTIAGVLTRLTEIDRVPAVFKGTLKVWTPASVRVNV